MSKKNTIDDLRNTCCLCFSKGEVDLLQQKVTIENMNDDNTEYGSEESFEINAMDLFEIYQNTDIFSLSLELKLMCHACLEELIVCYKFYRKIIGACQQKQRLLEATQKQQTEVLDDLIIEVQWDSNNAQLETKTPTENSFTEKDPVTQAANIVQTPTTAMTQSELSSTLPPDLSGDQIDVEEEEFTSLSIDDCIPLNDCETISFDENIIYQSDHETENNIEEEVKLPEVKRPRLKFSREKVSGSSGPVQPPHEGASLVVTQFLPVKMCLKTESLQNKFSINESGQDLNTVDYAAVEIKSSNFQHANNGEIVFENNDDYDDDSKEQIFVCKYCPQAFSAAPYLIAHVRKSHVCKYCTQAFVKSLDLFVHIRQVHYQHKCAICQKELSSQSNLRGHIKRVHGIRLPAKVALLDYKTHS